MSSDEFRKAVSGGEELVILDDLVLNVAKFKSEHPGGKFLVEYNVGRDISKFFYGGYSLENHSGLSPHTHSNVARSIIKSLVVARLSDRAKTFTAKI